MNTVLEDKMKELLVIAEQEAAPAAYVVLHLLLSSHLNGHQNKFAQHCCEYSPVRITQTAVNNYERPDDFFGDLTPASYCQ